MAVEIESSAFPAEMAKRRRCAGYAANMVAQFRQGGITTSDAIDACELAIIMLHAIRSDEIRREETAQEARGMTLTGV